MTMRRITTARSPKNLQWLSENDKAEKHTDMWNGIKSRSTSSWLWINKNSNHNVRIILGILCAGIFFRVCLFLSGTRHRLSPLTQFGSFGDVLLRRGASMPGPIIESMGASEYAYQSALLTLRCLTTPGCFRSLKCRTGIPQKIPRTKKWEEQAFCVDDVKAKLGNCLVYSFGIHDSWEWEVKVANLFGCEVHAFDPTQDHPTELAPGVTFHSLGLQGAGTDMSQTHSAEYTAIDTNKLLPLPTIMERLGHSNRRLDLLMLDCEGCEWGTLRQMMCHPSSDNNDNNNKASRVVDQILVEMHFQKNLGLQTEADVLQAAEAVVCLEQERWGIVSQEESGCGKEDATYARDVTKVLQDDAGSFLMTVALQRIPDTKLLPHERIESIAALSQPWFHARKKCFGKYGEQEQTWPEDACPEYRKLDKKYENKIQKYLKVIAKRSTFDDPPLMNEMSQAGNSTGKS